MRKISHPHAVIDLLSAGPRPIYISCTKRGEFGYSSKIEAALAAAEYLFEISKSPVFILNGGASGRAVNADRLAEAVHQIWDGEKVKTGPTDDWTGIDVFLVQDFGQLEGFEVQNLVVIESDKGGIFN